MAVRPPEKRMVPVYVGTIIANVLRVVVAPAVRRASENRQYRRHTARRAEPDSVERIVQDVERRKVEEAARGAGPQPSIESVMDTRHGFVRIGMDAQVARARMGATPSVSTLGGRELWNYPLGSSPARWQVLVEGGTVVGVYTRGAYRFKRDEAG